MRQVTIHMLRSHIAKVAAKPDAAKDGFVDTVAALLKRTDRLDPNKDPRQRWAYQAALWMLDAALGNYEVKRLTLAGPCLVMAQMLVDPEAQEIHMQIFSQMPLFKAARRSGVSVVKAVPKKAKRKRGPQPPPDLSRN